MKKAKLFVINSIILTITAIIIRTVGMSFNVYVSNKVGAECIGLFQLVMSVYLFAITIATSGISIAATRLTTEYLTKNDKTSSKIVITKCLIYSLILGLFASFIIIIFSNTLTEVCFHNKITKTPILAIAIGLPFISMSAAINGYFSAVRKVFKTASSQILEQFVKIIATSYLLSLFLPKGLDYAILSLIIGDVISEVISFTYIFFLFLSDKKKLFLNTANENLICKNKIYRKEILDIAFPIAITSCIRSGLNTLKQLIIPIRLEKSGMSCTKALSDYGLISGMAMPLLLFPNVIILSVCNLLIPEYSAFYAKNDYEKIRYISNKILKITSIFSICIFGIFLTFSNEISSMLYKDAEVVYYIKILCPLVLTMYIDSIIDSMLKGLNKQVAVMKCNILDLVISTSLLYILLPVIGIMGYVVVLYISEILNTTVSLYQLIKTTKIKLNYIQIFVLPLASAFLARYVIKVININLSHDLISLISEITIFVIAYIGFLSFTKVITKKDIKLF